MKTFFSWLVFLVIIGLIYQLIVSIGLPLFVTLVLTLICLLWKYKRWNDRRWERFEAQRAYEMAKFVMVHLEAQDLSGLPDLDQHLREQVSRHPDGVAWLRKFDSARRVRRRKARRA